MRNRIVFIAMGMGVLAAIACGGRSAARAVTTPTAPATTAHWERPSRMSDAEPAVRLDREDDAPAAEEPDGARVRLEPGMTLYSLAREYQVAVDTIMAANQIDDPTNIKAGTEIFIPSVSTEAAPSKATPRPAHGSGGKRPAADVPHPQTYGKGTPAMMSIAWPLDGRITGAFGLRGQHHHHDGIDIDGTRGEEVRAVAAGVVVRAGNEGKYGKTVVIDHGNGVSTLYAHASRLLVDEGDQVGTGDAIAEVGATGNAHGTHLHFEVRRDGRPVDPLPYLKPEMLGRN